MKLKYNNMLNVKPKRGCVVVYVITTNGFVTNRGKAVMGRGIAREMNQKYNLEYKLGSLIRKNGNIVQIIDVIEKNGKTKVFVSFPVKETSMKVNKTTLKSHVVTHAQYKYKSGDIVPGFHLKSSLKLIDKSFKQLNEMICTSSAYKEDPSKLRVIMPRPGCGAGELEWKDVFPIVWKYKNIPRLEIFTFAPNKTEKPKKIKKNINMKKLLKAVTTDRLLIVPKSLVNTMKLIGYTNFKVSD